MLKQSIASVREDVQKLEPSYMVSGTETGMAALENSLEVPQILNTELPCDLLSNSIPT